ncbi:hypothetical protein DFH09DRAFT_1093696 [Mycena vulgaris]|nr:hypothetical protein DFH09DRAFT_1093696 [Mycena vulgaris]
MKVETSIKTEPSFQEDPITAAAALLVLAVEQAKKVVVAARCEPSPASIALAEAVGVLEAKVRDVEDTARLQHVDLDAARVMRRRRNGNSEREKLAAQRQQRKIRKSAVHRDQLTNYDSLKAERESGNQEYKESVEWEKSIQMQIKINSLRRDVDDEKSLCREWTIRRTAIDVEIGKLKKGPLAGARIQGLRPAERPSGVDASSSLAEDLALERERQFTPLPDDRDVTVDFTNTFSTDASRGDESTTMQLLGSGCRVRADCIVSASIRNYQGLNHRNPSNSATTSIPAADTFWDNLNLDPSIGDYGSDQSADFPEYRPTGVTGEEYGVGAKELEYIGPQTEYPGMGLPIPRGIDSRDLGELPALKERTIRSAASSLLQLCRRCPGHRLGGADEHGVVRELTRRLAVIMKFSELFKFAQWSPGKTLADEHLLSNLLWWRVCPKGGSASKLDQEGGGCNLKQEKGWLKSPPFMTFAASLQQTPNNV